MTVSHARVPIVSQADWWPKAACKGMAADLFYPERGESTTRVKQICAECSVRLLCLEYAIDHFEDMGIWGGLSGRERRRLKRQRRLAAV